ncbi:hypothetical protein [Parabacteroides timonensis]|uniref:hypothetical protein n=1 Tax=Parabacteroides timonensis TaxID=1871013 RepID=UPI00111530DA|nr:hypothetical protein [Parabacteroides timonensis]
MLRNIAGLGDEVGKAVAGAFALFFNGSRGGYSRLDDYQVVVDSRILPVVEADGSGARPGGVVGKEVELNAFGMFVQFRLFGDMYPGGVVAFGKFPFADGFDGYIHRSTVTVGTGGGEGQ